MSSHADKVRELERAVVEAKCEGVLHYVSPREQVLTMKAVSSNRGTPLAGGPNQRGRWGGFHAFGGDVMHNPNPKLDEVDLWARIIPTEGCWHWVGYIDNRPCSGYGRVRWLGKNAAAHRVVYEMLCGPVPEGLTLDHLCRNRSCVNPAHLEPVTGAENTLRGESASARHARQTRCVHGHPLSGHNLFVDSRGLRVCRECRRERGKLVNRRARLAAMVGAGSVVSR